MTDESRESTAQGDVERTEEGTGTGPRSAPGMSGGVETRTDGGAPKNAGERTVEEQKGGGFAEGGHEGPYGGGESPGHDPDADLLGRSETH